MTNDEIRRNDEILMTKPAFRDSGFGFLSSFVIRHLSFNSLLPPARFSSKPPLLWRERIRFRPSGFRSARGRRISPLRRFVPASPTLRLGPEDLCRSVLRLRRESATRGNGPRAPTLAHPSSAPVRSRPSTRRSAPSLIRSNKAIHCPAPRRRFAEPLETHPWRPQS